jgi:hypothetical protein
MLDPLARFIGVPSSRVYDGRLFGRVHRVRSYVTPNGEAFYPPQLRVCNKLQSAFDQAMKRIYIAAVSLVFASPALAQSWTPGGETNRPGPVVASGTSPSTVTHSLESAVGTKRAVIGVNDRGGGYINSVLLYGYGIDGVNIVIPDFGKGWQGSVRDNLHGGRYNPTQAGFRDLFGAPVSVVENSTLLVRQFAMPLYGDPVYDFLANETGGVMDVYRDDGGNSDADYLGDETTLDQELRSEFDHSVELRDTSARFGLPSFSRSEYNMYARPPSAIRQFTDLRAVYSSGSNAGQPIFRPENRIRDASLITAGDQTPTATDLSYVIHTAMAVRVPSARFRYLHFESGGRSRVMTLDTSSLFNCASPVAVGSYVYTSGRRARGPATNSTCTLDMPLMILSTSSDPATGVGVGLYVPEESSNAEQVQKIGPDGTTTRENRRIASVFAIDYTNQAGQQFYALRLRNYISGLFAPGIATEGLTNVSYFLFGTPNEIFSAQWR